MVGAEEACLAGAYQGAQDHLVVSRRVFLMDAFFGEEVFGKAYVQAILCDCLKILTGKNVKQSTACRQLSQRLIEAMVCVLAENHGICQRLVVKSQSLEEENAVLARSRIAPDYDLCNVSQSINPRADRHIIPSEALLGILVERVYDVGRIATQKRLLEFSQPVEGKALRDFERRAVSKVRVSRQEVADRIPSMHTKSECSREAAPRNGLLQIQGESLGAESEFKKDFEGRLKLGRKVATEGFEILVRNHGHDLL